MAHADSHEDLAVVGCVVSVHVDLLDPRDVGLEARDGLPEEHEVHELAADAPLLQGQRELVGVEVPLPLR